MDLIAEHDPVGKFRNKHISLWYPKIHSVVESQKATNNSATDLRDLTLDSFNTDPSIDNSSTNNESDDGLYSESDGIYKESDGLVMDFLEPF